MNPGDAIASGPGSTWLEGSLLETVAPSPPREAEQASEPEPATRPILRSSMPLILVVEDNPGDVRLVREVVTRWRRAVRLQIAQDGLQALRLLRQSGDKPDLILLDLNLPGMDGRTLLQRIKTDPELLRIPVIVVSGSDADRDVLSAYVGHANCYVVKPADFQAYERTLAQLIEFWLQTARLPDR